ncbi:MAG: C4-type zinc ribbon domain-containing protein [SAR324 cluster bacterium]|nr:C4-type zinc ribbon domain-containing protein [SAR324 cluster bacterium]
MQLTIQPLIDLANTDLELQTSIYSRSHLERQIDSARSVVDQHQKLFEQKNNELELLTNEGKEVKNNIQIQEQLILRLDEQVPKIRNEKEFAASKNQLEEARKMLGLLEDKMLELDMKKEDLDQELESVNSELTESSSAFQEETSGLLKKQEKAEKKIAKLEPRRNRQLKKIPQNIKRFYERCQESGISTPVCAIQDKSCSGCNMVLLPQLVNELMANPNAHKNCPYCSRILYFPEVEKEEELES